MIKTKREETRISAPICVCVCVEGGMGEGFTPLPTCPRRYQNPMLQQDILYNGLQMVDTDPNGQGNVSDLLNVWKPQHR